MVWILEESENKSETPKLVFVAVFGKLKGSLDRRHLELSCLEPFFLLPTLFTFYLKQCGRRVGHLAVALYYGFTC